MNSMVVARSPAVATPRSAGLHSAGLLSPFAAQTWLFAICLAGVLARLAMVVLLPNIVWPDETFQYVEQASRLLGGHALVPWEYQVGARSWLLPLLITPAVAVGRLIFHSPEAVYASVAVEMIALSVAAAIAAYWIGRRVGSSSDGLFAAFLVTFWSEAVYLSPHALADTISADLLLVALAASLRADSLRAVLTAGALLGATFVARLQLAPALAIIGVFALSPSPVRRGGVLALGFAVPVVLAGLLDWVTWGAPFHSFVTYVRVNGGGVAGMFGAKPPIFYLAHEVAIWGWATPLVLLTAGLGAKHLPVGLLVVGAIFATFSVVGHKEYRFIYPAIPVLLTLCGVGTAEIAADLGARLPVRRWMVTAALALLWCLASAVSALSPLMLQNWVSQRDVIAAEAAVNSNPASCGVAVAPSDNWWATGASRFRDNVPLFSYSAASARAFNYVLAFKGAPDPGPDFHPISCGPGKDLCLYRRSGGCDPKAGTPLEAAPSEALAEALRRMRLR